MKSLLEYIMEREYFNPDVDINILQPILQTISDGGILDDTDVNYINSLINGSFSVHVIDGIVAGYLFSKKFGLGKEPHDKISIGDTEKLVELVRRIPVDRIQRFLGAGAEGFVLNIGNDMVVKMFFTDSDPIGMSWDLLFTIFENIQKENPETLPKIYKVKRPYVIREAVKMNTPKCKKYFDISTTKYKLPNGPSDMLYGIVADYSEDSIRPLLKSDIEIEVLDWLVKLRDEMENLGIVDNQGESCFGEDFKLANIGETKDGRVVCFDF